MFISFFFFFCSIWNQFFLTKKWMKFFSALKEKFIEKSILKEFLINKNFSSFSMSYYLNVV